MGYGGKQAVRSGDIRRFNFTGNGSNTAFDLGFTPATQNQLIVTVNGLVQHYDAFSVTGSTLTFTGTPASGDTIQVTAVVDAVGVAAIPDGAIANVSTLTVSGNTTLNGILTATANVNIDSGTLFVDGTNNRVGINNTAPTSALTVTGAAAFSNTVAVTGNATFSNTVAVTGSLTTTSNVHTIGTALYSVANGNIGIDNSSPDRQLVVGGTRSASASNWSQFRANVGGSPPSSSNPYGLFIGCNYSGGSSEANFAYSGFLTFASWDGTTYTERMRIDSSGRVTTPYQPAFHAVNTTIRQVDGSAFIFDTAILNVGSHYNTSNGRFTVPIAGVYFFHMEFLTQNGNTNVVDLRFYKNGSQTQLATVYLENYTSGSYRKGFMTAIVSLNVGDYITVQTQNGASNGNLYGDNNEAGGKGHTSFKGYLLG